MRKQQSSIPAMASKQTAPKYGMAEMPRDSLAGRMQSRGTLQTTMEQPRNSLARRMQERGTLPVSSDPNRVLPTSAAPRVPPTSSNVSPGNSQITAPWTSILGGLPDRFAVPKCAPPTPASRKLSVAQRLRNSVASRMRKSLAAHMRADQYRPKRRKVGKQRPSCALTAVPAATPYKPRRRKVGKQRPSIVLQSHNHKPLISPAELKKQAEQIGRLFDEPIKSEGAEHPKRKQNANNASCVGGASKAAVEIGANQPEASVQTLGGPSTLFMTIPLKASKSPSDNYDLSDYEEDVSGKRIEPNRKGKRVPAWSLKYKELTNAQADLDPESIFGSRVPRCDLDLIFPDRLYREQMGWVPVKRKRGDSGQWFKDRLTRTEISAYKRRTGQTRIWSKLRK
mmetsp:Transcript_38542/g.69186  ORF Transcript_38542/g.69186 Transcript_38542/m.69186 type:complete len:396 (-) Transcript_38542:208-1395(-)